jgi:ribosomal protein S18 acetylase RimI-like enzyme
MNRNEGWVIREIDRIGDAAALQQLDTSFASQWIYEVKTTENSLQLGPVRAATSKQKEFPINLDNPRWDQGCVALKDGMVKGFIATRCDAWNRRLAIWHFYVDLNHRKQGVGRLLMEHAIETGRRSGATTAWVETSNYNYPGIEAYRHLGFFICGFDLTLYQGTPSEGEFAVYLARPIATSSANA